jgi:hypothetical protein
MEDEREKVANAHFRIFKEENKTLGRCITTLYGI